MGRLIEFSAAALAVGGAGWRGFLAYWKFRNRWRKRRL